MIVYLAHNKINAKNYVGQTTSSLRLRKNNHYRDSKRYNTRFCNALRKYNKEDWEWSILKFCDNIEELNRWEIFYIKLLRCNDRNFGYNIAEGGLNAPVTEETKKKLSVIGKGRKQSEEAKKNIGDAIRKRTQTEEYRKAFSEKIKGNKIWLGKKHTEKTKEKISQSNIGKHSETWRGKKHSKETKKKMSESAKKRYKNNPMSEYTKRKLSESKKIYIKK